MQRAENNVPFQLNAMRAESVPTVPSEPNTGSAPQKDALSFLVMTHEQFAVSLMLKVMGKAPEDFDRITSSAILWFKKMEQRAPNNPTLCMDCEQKFSRTSHPHALMIALPMFDTSFSLVTGICAHCYAKPDLVTRCTSYLLKLFPDATMVDIGTA